ncbi:hypothetical protein [Oceanobacillus kimchii]|nr:hypothetical protein [Oceanobacillus kimchii]
MDVRITKNSGEQFLLSDYGITVQDFNITSIPINPLYSEIEGQINYL